MAHLAGVLLTGHLDSYHLPFPVGGIDAEFSESSCIAYSAK